MVFSEKSLWSCQSRLKGARGHLEGPGVNCVEDDDSHQLSTGSGGWLPGGQKRAESRNDFGDDCREAIQPAWIWIARETRGWGGLAWSSLGWWLWPGPRGDEELVSWGKVKSPV